MQMNKLRVRHALLRLQLHKVARRPIGQVKADLVAVQGEKVFEELDVGDAAVMNVRRRY